MTETANETTEAIGYARRILHETRQGGPDGPGDVHALAELVRRYDHLLAEDEPGIFSWHQALYDVAQQAKRAAEKVSAASPVTVTIALSGLPGSCPHCGETPPDGTWPVGTHGGLVVLCPCCYVVVAPVRAVAAVDPVRTLKNGDRVLVIPLDVKGTVILTRLDGTVAVVADNATRPCVWERSEVRFLPDDDPVGEMLAPLTDVDMVCTSCRMPVVRGGPGWVHLTALGSSRCRRLEADVTAMVAAGNENAGDGLRSCSRCGDRVGYLSSRDLCDGCEAEADSSEEK